MYLLHIAYVFLKKEKMSIQLRTGPTSSLPEPEPTLPFGLSLSEPTYRPFWPFKYRFHRKTTKNHNFLMLTTVPTLRYSMDILFST